jgi:DNA-binding CsgD family transcriptional regulator
MKSENNTLDYPQKSHFVIRRDAPSKKHIPARTIFGSEIVRNNPLCFFDCCLIDHSGRQFACIHEHCRRCFNTDRLNDKHEFQAVHFHPEDRELWDERVFPDILSFMNPVPADELPDYRLSFNHRFILKNETISEFLLEGTFASSVITKLPVLNLNVFTEIGNIKTDESINLTIYRYSILYGYQKVFSKVYVKKCDSFLSNRELEIIKLCHEGQSSKMIADKLNLSIHTIKNHKRNCMEKTMTHNISELIHYCLVYRWL